MQSSVHDAEDKKKADEMEVNDSPIKAKKERACIAAEARGMNIIGQNGKHATTNDKKDVTI